MSSLSSVLSYVGASLPILFLAGLLWVTATSLDTDSSHSPRKRTVPGSWDSPDDEHLLLISPPRPRHTPSVIRTVSSALTSLAPFSQPRSISSTSLIVSCPSTRPIPLPHKKRPSARASSTGVSQTSTIPKIYSRLTTSQYRSTSIFDEAVNKAQSAKALATGRKNLPTKTKSAGYRRNGGSRVSPLADNPYYASFVRVLESWSLSGPEKKKNKEVSYPVGEDKFADGKSDVKEPTLHERGLETACSPPEPAPLPPVDPSAEPTYQLESAPLALAAPTSLAAKLKFDGFRCGLAPLAAFRRSFQPFKPSLPLPAPSTPRPNPTVDVVMKDESPSPHFSRSPFERMELDQPSPTAPTTRSSTSTSPGILRKISQITKQFVNLQVQPSPAPVNLSPLVGMMAQLSVNDKQQTRKAQLPRPTSAWSRRIQQSVKPQSTSLSAPSPQAASSSGQSSSVPVTAVIVNTEKKQTATAPTPSSSSATSGLLPKSATPATPQRPAGQVSLPAPPARRRPLPLFASARKALAQRTSSKSTASSSSGQPSSAKAAAIPPTAEKKKPTPPASTSKPLPQSAAPKQSATSSSSGQSSAPTQASAAKTETKKLPTMGAIDPKLANILDQLEAEENEAKTEKPKPKPTRKPEPKPEPEVVSEDELSFDDLEKQLAIEELAMENEVKSVPKYQGKDRKIAPLKRK